MKFEITKTPSMQDLKFLTEKINAESPDMGIAEAFGIFLKDKNGTIIAGCDGSIIFGSIHTDQLWVDPKQRGKGLGKELMEQVHEYGRKNGCILATVTTMSFQAPNFYQKLGYTIDFSRKGYNKNAACIVLSKKL